MKRIVIINQCGRTTIARQAENEVTEVQIPVQDLLDIGPDGYFMVWVHRPDGRTTPAVTVLRPPLLCWTPTAGDTDVAGFGALEVRYYIGTALAVSAVYPTLQAGHLGRQGIQHRLDIVRCVRRQTSGHGGGQALHNACGVGA